MNIYYMRLAIVAADAATCIRRKVGAVVVCGDKVIGVGYNKIPEGTGQCVRELECKLGGKGCRRTIHAEQIALMNCSEVPDGSVIFVTTEPCLECAKTIFNCGIRSVFYYREYRTHEGVDYLKRHGVTVEKLVSDKLHAFSYLIGV